jgi:DNA repair exonuclease SbcCD ATPase subunit
VIRILKQRVLNFASYVNPVVPYEAETTLIGGPNGAGKSTFVEAMRYALANDDLQHPERHKEYYTQDKGAGRNRYSAATLTFTNRTRTGKPDVFHRIGIKEPMVTLGVVYAPHADGKTPRYHVMAGDVAMKEFVEEAKAKGTSRKEFRAKLTTCLITQDIINHVLVKQGTAGEYAKKTPRDLYTTVLAQSGHAETKAAYEAAAEESKHTGRQLRDRELEAKHCKVDLQDAQQSVRALDDYEAKENELVNLHLEERARGYWMLGRERRDLDAALTEARTFMEGAAAQILEAAQGVAEEEGRITDLQRRVQDFETNRKMAERVADEAKQRLEKADDAMEKTIRAEEEWERVQYASTSEEARNGYQKLVDDLGEAQRRGEARKEEHRRLQSILKALEGGRLEPPSNVQAVLDAAKKQGINADVLANIIGAQDGLVEAALQQNVWSIVCSPKHVDAVARILQNQACTVPVVASDNEYWKSWTTRKDWLHTAHGTVAAPQPEPRLLVDRTPQRIAELTRAVVGLDVEIRKAGEHMVVVQEDLRKAGKAQEDAATKERLGPKPPNAAASKKQYGAADAAYKAAAQAVEEVRRNSPDLLHAEIVEREKALAPKKSKLEKLQERHESAEQVAGGHPARILELDAKLRGISDLPADYQHHARAIDEPMRKQYEIERDLRSVRGYLEKNTKPDPEVRFRASSLDDRYRDLERRIKETQDAYQGTVKALEEAQVKYGQTANSVMADFRRRFEAVSDSFHVKPTVDFTTIKAAMSIDEINAATLDITVQFGDKPPLRLRGGLSGGEGAVAGMLLRLCMMNNDATGFFVVDEPYQSLDDRNVRLIAEFLESSEYQVIMVVPNSQDPNQYRGALRGVRVRPQETDGTSPAPDLIGIERQEAPVAA